MYFLRDTGMNFEIFESSFPSVVEVPSISFWASEKCVINNGFLEAEKQPCSSHFSDYPAQHYVELGT